MKSISNAAGFDKLYSHTVVAQSFSFITYLPKGQQQ